MRTTKRIASLVLVFAMLLPFATAEAQEDYVTRGTVAQMLLVAADDYNSGVQKTDILRGYEDGELHEERSVTRAEALIMLRRAFGPFPALTAHTQRLSIPKENFTDIPAWANEELQSAFDSGIVAGTAPGVFSPDEKVTRAQMELFISRLFSLYGTNLKDSFYASINKDYLATLAIPEGSTTAGTLYKIREDAQKQVQDIIAAAAVSAPEKGSAQDKIKILYNNITDMKSRNAAAIAPIKADIEAIDNMKSLSELSQVKILDNTSIALSLLANFSLTIDSADSNSYIEVFVPASASLAKQVYEGKNDVQKAAYIKYLTKLLELCGTKDAQSAAQAYYDFDKQLSDASLDIAEQYDLTKTYNIYTVDEICAMFPSVDIKALYEYTNLKKTDKIQLKDVKLAQQLSTMLTEDNLEAVKNYIKINLIVMSAGLLDENFRNAGIEYNQEAFGIVGSKTIEEDASEIVAAVLGDYVGEEYAKLYCTQEIIDDMTAMVHSIIDTYKKRIAALDWMSDTTKEKAIKKLETMRIKVGAPDYSEYPSAMDNAELKSTEDGGDYFKNMMQIRRANLLENARLSNIGVDKEQWIMTPQIVNAGYMAAFNSINFPMAFLQAPIYSINASREENLGAIGMVIAHEITHAFDSNGAQYDEMGNAVNWWSEEDAAAFSTLCEKVAKFYDGREAAPGIVMDGTMTLTENVADMGAMACVTEIGKNTKDFDFKKMYESFARLWASTTSRESAQNSAFADVHSSSVVRVDRTLQTVDEFYETYDIKAGDGMYTEPADRVKIW